MVYLHQALCNPGGDRGELHPIRSGESYAAVYCASAAAWRWPKTKDLSDDAARDLCFGENVTDKTSEDTCNRLGVADATGNNAEDCTTVMEQAIEQDLAEGSFPSAARRGGASGRPGRSLQPSACSPGCLPGVAGMIGLSTQRE